MESGRFQFGHAVVLVPPPAYPPGAALFEHQTRCLGVGILEPSKPDDAAGSTPTAVPAAVPEEHSLLVASTAHCVWPAAYSLAVSLHAPIPAVDVRGCAVIELGAGCGLPGLAAWRAGAESVCLTELPENLPRLQRLVDHNGASGAVRVEALDWTRPLPEPIASRRWDVVLSADCVFWPELFEPLLSTLEALVHPKTRVILAVSDRLGRCADFEALAARRGWALTECRAGALDGAPPLPPGVMPVPAAQPAPRLLMCARAT